MGHLCMSNVRDQIALDRRMVADGKKVVWVFVASKHSGIGPDSRVLAALESAGIDVEIHWS